MRNLKLFPVLFFVALLALVGCSSQDEVAPTQASSDTSSEIELIEQELGVSLIKKEVELTSKDRLVSTKAVIAAATQRQLDNFLFFNKLRLNATYQTQELAVSDQDEVIENQSEVNYMEGIIIELSETQLSEGVDGISLSFDNPDIASSAKPGDLTDNYNEQVFLINNDAKGFNITQGTTGPPAPLDAIGVEFWYKKGFLQFSWKFKSFGTISAGQSRSDSKSGARKVQVVVGYQTQSALFTISFF